MRLLLKVHFWHKPTCRCLLVTGEHILQSMVSGFPLPPERPEAGFESASPRSTP